MPNNLTFSGPQKLRQLGELSSRRETQKQEKNPFKFEQERSDKSPMKSTCKEDPNLSTTGMSLIHTFKNTDGNLVGLDKEGSFVNTYQ